MWRRGAEGDILNQAAVTLILCMCVCVCWIAVYERLKRCFCIVNSPQSIFEVLKCAGEKAECEEQQPVSLMLTSTYLHFSSGIRILNVPSKSCES